MDFPHDNLHAGSKFSLLPMIDTKNTKECFEAEADMSIRSQRIAQVLTRLPAFHGLPGQMVVDNGPEFIIDALDAWAYVREKIQATIHPPGKPIDNCYMESFNDFIGTNASM